MKDHKSENSPFFAEVAYKVARLADYIGIKEGPAKVAAEKAAVKALLAARDSQK